MLDSLRSYTREILDYAAAQPALSRIESEIIDRDIVGVSGMAEGNRILTNALRSALYSGICKKLLRVKALSKSDIYAKTASELETYKNLLESGEEFEYKARAFSARIPKRMERNDFWRSLSEDMSAAYNWLSSSWNGKR